MTQLSNKPMTLERKIDQGFSYLYSTGKKVTTVVFNYVPLVVEKTSSIDEIVAQYHNKLEEQGRNI